MYSLRCVGQAVQRARQKHGMADDSDLFTVRTLGKVHFQCLLQKLHADCYKRYQPCRLETAATAVLAADSTHGLGQSCFARLLLGITKHFDSDVR